MTGVTKRHSAPPHAAGATGRARPRRQRTPTTHYSDDNPSTFTKKKKRRRGQPAEEEEDDSDGDEADLAPTPPPTLLLEPSRKRPRPSSTTTMPLSPAPPPPPPDMVLPHAIAISPVFPLQVGKNPTKSLRQEFPVVFGRGLGLPPPLAKPSWQPIMSVNREFYFPQDYQSQALSNGTTVPVLPPKAPTVSRCISCLTVEKTRQQHLAMADTAGFVTLYSLHPRLVEVTRLETTHAAEREYHDQSQQHRMMLQNSRKPKTGMALVTGTAAATAQQHPAFERFQDVNVIQAMSFGQSLLVLATLIEIECWTVSSTSTSTPQRLWTHTWNPNHQHNNRKPTIMCPLRLDLATAVRGINTDCCLASFYLGATTHAKDDVVSASSPLSSSNQRSPLWLLTPSSEAPNSTNDTDDSESKAPITTSCDPQGVTATELYPLVNGKVPQFGPHCTAIWDAFHHDCPRILMAPLVMASEGDDKPDGAPLDETTAKSRHHSQQPHRRQELWLVEYRSPDYVVTKRAVLLPKANLKTPALEATLCQANAQFTLVACSKGIRLYETDTLHLLQVYGEHLALHGQSIMWQDVLVCPRWTFPDQQAANQEHDGGAVVLRPDVIEYTDFLATKRLDGCNIFEPKRSSGEATLTTSSNARGNAPFSWLEEGNAWIIGVPHAERGPRELCDTLHVWDWCRGDCKTPAFTVAGPGTRSKGIQSLVVVAGDKGEITTTSAATGSSMRLILCTKSGDCREYAPTTRSDWPGIMFPPDYHVIGENVEYIEDEDELDCVVDEAGASDDDENDEEHHVALRAKELRQDQEEALLVAEAMERSVQEMSFDGGINADEGHVVVVKGKSRQLANVVISCQPEAYLRHCLHPELLMSQADNELNEKATSSGNTSSTNLLLSTQVLPCLPQRELVRGQVQAQLDRPHIPPAAMTADPAASDTSSLNGSSSNGKVAVKGGKRSRASNLEALLKASINPSLRRFMLSKDKVWANGVSSSVRPWDRNIVTKEETSHADKSSAWQVHVASREEETALALGLLQLSPVKPAFLHKASTLIAPDVDTEQSCGDSAGRESATLGTSCSDLPCVTSESDNGHSPMESSQLTTVTTDTQQSDLSSEAVNGTGTTLKENSVEKAAPSQQFATSASLPEKDIPALAPPLDSSTPVGNPCDACRGRMTVHVCGSRALPVDVDALVRAEQEQKRKEEEDKRKAIAEKRRIAAARRKETKLKKHQELEARRPKEAWKHETATTLWQNGYGESQSSSNYKFDGKAVFEHDSHLQRATDATTVIVPATTSYFGGISHQQPAPFTTAHDDIETPRCDSFPMPKPREFLAEEVSSFPTDFSQQNSFSTESESKLITAQALAALAAFAGPHTQVKYSQAASYDETQLMPDQNSIGDPTCDHDGQGFLTARGGNNVASHDEVTSSGVHSSNGHGFIMPQCTQIGTVGWIENPPYDINGGKTGAASDMDCGADVSEQCS